MSSRGSFLCLLCACAYSTLIPDPLTSFYHGVTKQTLFVKFNRVQDAEKVFSALDGKVTVDGHQYDLVYSRERIVPLKPRVAPKARWNK